MRNKKNIESGSDASAAMRRVVEAMIAGDAPAESDRNALTEDELAEVAVLARTATLARLTLHAVEPPAGAADAALGRAHLALRAQRSPVGGMQGDFPDASAPDSLWSRIRSAISGKGRS